MIEAFPLFSSRMLLQQARDQHHAEEPTGSHAVASFTRTFDDYNLDELREYIDWSPFFGAWEMRGRFPDLLHNPATATVARKLYEDAQRMLDRLTREKWLRAAGTFGLFPANRVGTDDLEVYTDESRTGVRTTLHHLRQQGQHREGIPNRSLADFVAPKETGLADYVGAFAVTAGHGSAERVAAFKADLDDYGAILLESLADRLAEAFAERLHQRVRREFWGYAPDEHLAGDDLIAERYRGIRPAPGYPACPDHTEKITLFNLLQVPEHTGISLTESLAMFPAASVSGWYFAHPGSRYFGLGKIGKDQVEDYAARKNRPVPDVERWLRPVLNY